MMISTVLTPKKPIVNRFFVGSIALLWVLLAACAPSTSHAADPLRLQDAITRALAAHPAIAAETAQLQAVSAQAARASLPPPWSVNSEVENIAGTGDLRGITAMETTLSLNRVIELGGKRAAREQLGRAEVREQALVTGTARLDIASQTATRFIEVLARQQRLNNAQERIRQAEQTRREVAAWVRVARNPDSDLQAADIALAEAELDHERSEHDLASARMALAASWGALTPDFGTAIGELGTLPEVEPFEILAARLAQTPELRALRLQAETIRARRRLSEAEAKPDLDLGFGVRRMQEGRDHGLVLALSVPLGSRRRAGYALAAADAELAALEARYEAARFERHQQLFARYQNLIHERHELDALTTTIIPKAERALATTRRGFEAGRFSFLSLAQAQATLFELNIRAVEAATGYHLALVEVERLTATTLDIAP